MVGLKVMTETSAVGHENKTKSDGSGIAQDPLRTSQTAFVQDSMQELAFCDVVKLAQNLQADSVPLCVQLCQGYQHHVGCLQT